MELGTVVTSQAVLWDELEKEIAKDSLIEEIKADLRAGEAKGGFELSNGKLLYKGRYVIPKAATIIPSLLFEYHNSPAGGHAGDVKTYLRSAQEWF